jgi:hypothetical protein
MSTKFKTAKILDLANPSKTTGRKYDRNSVVEVVAKLPKESYGP